MSQSRRPGLELAKPFNGHAFLSQTPEGRNLLSDMKPTGDQTNQLFSEIFQNLRPSDDITDSRKRAAETVTRYLPHLITLVENFTNENGIIRVFAHNHRTLREPLDMAFLAMQQTDKQIVLPANLPWVALIHPEHVQMLQERLLIKPSPLVTPRTVKRMTDSVELQRVKKMLEASFWQDLEFMGGGWRDLRYGHYGRQRLSIC